MSFFFSKRPDVFGGSTFRLAALRKNIMQGLSLKKGQEPKSLPNKDDVIRLSQRGSFPAFKPCKIFVGVSKVQGWQKILKKRSSYTAAL